MTDQARDLPTGILTFLFSDVQDSTGLLQRLASGFKAVIERHSTIIRQCLTAHGGVEVSTEGDSFFAVFTEAIAAVEAASEIQKRLAAENWPAGGLVAVRIGLHTGTAELGGDNYVGLDVHRAARISAAGHGGQVVVSAEVHKAAAGFSYSDLGNHTLKGIEGDEHLFQLVIPGLSQSFPPLRTAAAHPNNLPALTSDIVGRQGEIDQLQTLVASHKLVTVTGPSGVGKTRLAIEAAKRMLGSFEAGVFFVDLAPLRDSALMLGEIASAVGFTSSDHSLKEYLSEGVRLLVLDNLEQLSDAASHVTALLSEAAPLKILATSQVPLRVGGEAIMRLDPLRADSDAALELLSARARQVDPTFDLEANRDDAVRLIDLVDGVPLAIELAAARLNVLTPIQVIDRIDSDVLQTSRADAPDRHRSISSAVAWSYDLLTRAQQELLQALSVFQGGAALDALAAIAGRDPLDDLAELVDRSLVRPSIGEVGKRFGLLASVQQFASSQLVDETPVSGHIDYFLKLTAEAHQPLEGVGRGKWMAVLTDDHDNIRVTLERLVAAQDVQRGFDLVGNAWRFFQESGGFDELALWLDRLFSSDKDGAPTLAKARALIARAGVSYWRADWQECAADYEAALVIADEAEDRALITEALKGLTSVRGIAMGAGIMIGDPGESAQRLGALAHDVGDKETIAYLEFMGGLMQWMSTRDPAGPGRDFFERMVTLGTDAGNLMYVAHNQVMYAEVEIVNGEHAHAKQVLLDAFTNGEEAGDILALNWGLSRFAAAAVGLGDPVLGARLAGAAHAAQRRSGATFPPALLPVPDALELATAEIGNEASRAFEEGEDLGLLDAVALARSTTS